MKATTYATSFVLAAGAVHSAPTPEVGVNMRNRRVLSETLDDSSELINGHQVVAFWGQGAEELLNICDTEDFDIIIMSQVTSLNPPKLDLSKDTGSPSKAQAAMDGWGLFDGTVVGSYSNKSIAEQIKDCQTMGKKVLISFGGDSTKANAVFSSTDEATQAAEYLWELFLGGTNMTDLRPFGSDVIMDGVDMDNESGNGNYYNDFVATLRGYFDSSSKTQYYLSGTPMCNQAAAGDKTSIPQSIMQYIDFLNIQFYNNDQQELGAPEFNSTVKQWDTLLSSISPSPKLLVGIPGGKGAADTGSGSPSNPPDIQTATQISKTVAGIKGLGLKNFGGIMIWDAGYAMSNDGFAAAVKGAL